MTRPATTGTARWDGTAGAAVRPGQRGAGAFNPAVVALDARTLARLARLLPALRAVPTDATALLAGQLAALGEVRLQQGRALPGIPAAGATAGSAAAGSWPTWTLWASRGSTT